MRVAYVINSLEGGGTTTPLPAIIEVLRSCGAEVRVFALTRRDGRGLARLIDAGVEVFVRDGGEKDHMAALRWLMAQLRDWPPAYLWTSLTRATLLGQLAGLRMSIPVISWQHAAHLKPANLRLLRLMQRLSVLWVADSASVARLTADRLKVAPHRLMTWPIFRADGQAPQSRGWQPGETLRLGSLGRLHPVKGYDVLIRSMAALQAMGLRLELRIGGDGAEREQLIALTQARGLTNITFAGYTDDTAQFLAGLHLYVQPSWSEGFCIAAHEAMQAGVPVVASAVGELASSVEPGVSGELVPPGSCEILARKIAWLMRDRERMNDMGIEARKRVLERFGPDRFEAAGRAVIARLRVNARRAEISGTRDSPRSPAP